MTHLLLLTILFATMTGLLTLIRQAPARDAQSTVEQIQRQILLGRQQAIAENAELILRGDSSRRVEALIGSPDTRRNGDWIYFRDEHSGYRIKFSKNSCVDNVDHWIS